MWRLDAYNNYADMYISPARFLYRWELHSTEYSLPHVLSDQRPLKLLLSYKAHLLTLRDTIIWDYGPVCRLNLFASTKYALFGARNG